MSNLWIENSILIACVAIVLAALWRSLKSLTRSRRWWYDAYALDEQAANEAWSAHRDEVAWEAVRLAARRAELGSLDYTGGA